MVTTRIEGEATAASTFGLAKVFQNIGGGSWSGIFVFTGANANSNAGQNVAINDAGTIIAIAEPGFLTGGFSGGRVSIFEYTGGAWSGIGDIVGEVTNAIGYSVALNSAGTIVAIGNPISLTLQKTKVLYKFLNIPAEHHGQVYIQDMVFMEIMHRLIVVVYHLTQLVIS